MAASTDQTARTARRMKALLLSPVVVLVASAVRLLLISNDDTATATTLASSSGVVGTLLGTIVPLLPAFLPVVLIFLVIFRRWRLFLLAAVATALVAPASIASVPQGLGVAWHSAMGIWYGLLRVWPAQGGALAHLVQTVWTWLKLVPGSLSQFVTTFLKATIGVDVNFPKLGHQLLSVWNGWNASVKVVAFCVFAALIWAIYVPPWSRAAQFYLPPKKDQPPRLPRLKTFFTGVAILLVSLVRTLSGLLYAVGIAAVCGFSVLYVQAVYDVPFNSKSIAEIARRPWLPAEKIRLSTGERPLVGYTMSVGNGWQVVLLERSRTVRYLRATDVVERKICYVGELAAPTRPPLVPLNRDDQSSKEPAEDDLPKPCFGSS